MSLPAVDTVRQRIESVRRQDMRTCLMCNYLFCGRISEVVAKACPRDTTVARGPIGRDVRLTTFELGPLKAKVAVFSVSTAKRDGLKRLVALPLDKEYEPWTEQVCNFFQNRGYSPVFPFTRQKAWQYAKKAFEGLRYPIYMYKIFEDGKVVKEVKQHSKPFATHALRHIRASELIEEYGFDGIDLSIYGGWTLRSMVGVGSSMQRYAHLRWQKYFPKLLRKRV